MCIVIDTCTFDTVFNPDAKTHLNFEPVLKWILKGNGKLVFGGTVYSEEIKQSPNRIGLVVELRKKRKVIDIEDTTIDELSGKISKKITDSDFDDPHIIALISISKSKLVCSIDKRAYPYFKNRNLYPNRRVPIIYSSIKHSKHLSDKNIPKDYI